MIPDLTNTKFTNIGWLPSNRKSFIALTHPKVGSMVLYSFETCFELIQWNNGVHYLLHPLELPWINKDLYVLTGRIKLKPLGSKTIYLVNGQWTHKKGP